MFTPGSLAKQSREGKSICEFFFPSFPSNVTICPVTTLKAYKRRTECIRSGVSKFFLATIKPHRVAFSSTIARWLEVYGYLHFHGPLSEGGITF